MLLGEHVIGLVLEKHVDNFNVDIGSAFPAALSVLAFEVRTLGCSVDALPIIGLHSAYTSTCSERENRSIDPGEATHVLEAHGMSSTWQGVVRHPT